MNGHVPHPRPGVYEAGPGLTHRWYTRQRAATELGVAVRTIQRWILDGRLVEHHGYVNARPLIDIEYEHRNACTSPSGSCAA